MELTNHILENKRYIYHNYTGIGPVYDKNWHQIKPTYKQSLNYLCMFQDKNQRFQVGEWDGEIRE